MESSALARRRAGVADAIGALEDLEVRAAGGARPHLDLHGGERGAEPVEQAIERERLRVRDRAGP